MNMKHATPSCFVLIGGSVTSGAQAATCPYTMTAIPKAFSQSLNGTYAIAASEVNRHVRRPGILRVDVRRSKLADEARRIAGHEHAGTNRRGDHRTRGHHGGGADVRHDDGRFADPGMVADVDLLEP